MHMHPQRLHGALNYHERLEEFRSALAADLETLCRARSKKSMSGKSRRAKRLLLDLHQAPRGAPR